MAMLPYISACGNGSILMGNWTWVGQCNLSGSPMMSGMWVRRLGICMMSLPVGQQEHELTAMSNYDAMKRDILRSIQGPDVRCKARTCRVVAACTQAWFAHKENERVPTRVVELGSIKNKALSLGMRQRQKHAQR